MGKVNYLSNTLQLIKSIVGVQSQVSGPCILNHYDYSDKIWHQLCARHCVRHGEYCYCP